MEDMEEGGMEWGSWLTGMGDKLLTAAIDAKVNNPQKLEELKISKLGALGYYSEGHRGILSPVAGLPPLVLYGGALLIAYLLFKG